MIRRISASDDRFHSVSFHEGMNLILADRTEVSDEYDSRNGLGKTSLVHLIHFCLGGDLPDSLKVEELNSWSFTLEIEVGGVPAVITRPVSGATRASLVGGEWLPQAADAEDKSLAVDDLNAELGMAFYGLPRRAEQRYAPTFRSLFSYAGRRKPTAFNSPLKHFHSQPVYKQQILQAFLCDLDWEYPRTQRFLHEEAEAIRNLRKAAKDGPLQGVIGTAGDLRAQKVQRERRLQEVRETIADFLVHPRYRELEKRADEVSEELKALANRITKDRRMLRSYEHSLQESEAAISGIEVEKLYAEIEVVLPDLVRNTLDSVQAFHESLRSERMGYLRAEMERLASAIEAAESDVEGLRSEREQVLVTLETHGSRQQYRALQREAQVLERGLGEIEEKLRIRTRIDGGGAAVRAKRAQNYELAQAAFDGAESARDRVISLFDRYWEALYGRGGRFVIDLTESGYNFDWEVERQGSEGVGKMKIFANDLALATSWATRAKGPGLLIHDSTIWDGVDERQVAAGLHLASRVAADTGLQYVTLLNTDMLPDPPHGASWDDAVAHRLTDAEDEGRLFGFAF